MGNSPASVRFAVALVLWRGVTLLAAATTFPYLWSSASMEPLYETLLGSSWTGLPPPVRRLHGGSGAAKGTFRVRRGHTVFARALGAILGMPEEGDAVAVTLAVEADPALERWTRSFAGKPLCTLQWRRGPLLVEALGLFLCLFRLREEGGVLLFEQVGAAVGVASGSLPLPRFLSPRIIGRAEADDGGVRVNVSIAAPLVGLVIAYEGRVGTETGA